MWKVCLIYSQNNKILWLSNMADTLVCHIHKTRKGMWASFYWLCFSGAAWLSRTNSDHMMLMKFNWKESIVLAWPLLSIRRFHSCWLVRKLCHNARIKHWKAVKIQTRWWWWKWTDCKIGSVSLKWTHQLLESLPLCFWGEVSWHWNRFTI